MTEILQDGLATRNPSHLKNLRQLNEPRKFAQASSGLLTPSIEPFVLS
jgi:hypothetical protein